MDPTTRRRAGSGSALPRAVGSAPGGDALGRTLTPRDYAALLGLALAVGVLLIVCFAPSLVTLRAWIMVPDVFGQAIPVRRGMWVARQVAEPFIEIGDPIHAIVRWRLLMPMIGYGLGLPSGVVLGFGPAGCVLTLALVIGVARTRAYRWSECALLAVAMGAGAWFFVSSEWLGYYDSWLMLGLLSVALVPSRWALWAACLLTPWVDERFVLGLPLALVVRLVSSSPEPVRRTVRDVTIAAALIAGYAALRLYLAGRAGSPSLSQYWHAIDAGIPPWRFAFGAWEGLRAGWIPALLAPVVLLRTGRVRAGSALLAAMALTVGVALASANDLSRSAALLLPAVPLGWDLARTQGWWTRWHLAPVVAGAALLLPANIVISTFTVPVNQLWYEVRLLLNPPPAYSPAAYVQQAQLAARQGDVQRARHLADVGLRLAPRDRATATAAAEVLRSLGGAP